MRKALLLAMAALAALPALPSPAGAVPGGGGQFVVRCQYSHTLPDDPVVFPGQPGASHLHDFFGNVSTNAGSTVETMLAGETTCRAASDTAGYWAPAAYLNGEPVTPGVMRIYYLGTPDRRTETIPPGLQIIGGTSTAASPEENPHVKWYCGETRDIKTPREPSPYDCRPWSQHAFVDGVVAIVDFPNCWDGVGLGSDSVVYPEPYGCPGTHPHVLPRLSERIHYGIMNPLNEDGSVALSLSSGPYWSMHADFWNTWQQERLDELVSSCLAGVHCGAIDASARPDWTREFGTARDDAGFATAAGHAGPYVVGSTREQLLGQPHRGGLDVLVRAYDVAGTERWTRELGTQGDDEALAVAAFRDRVVLAGVTDGRLPGNRRAGGADAFVTALDEDGETLWTAQFGTPADDRATAIAPAGADGVFVAGWTRGRMDGPRLGAQDAWVARLSRDGEILWIVQFGSPGADAIRAIATLGRLVLVAGWTDGTLPGRTSSGGSDAFVQAFSTTGMRRWTRQFGTSGNDVATALAAHVGDVFVAGTTDGAFPGQETGGGLDTFLRAMDAAGTTAWTDQLGTEVDDEAAGLVVRRSGIYLVGSTLGALADAGQIGDSDVFARRYLRRGADVWTIQLGTLAYDRAYGVGIDGRSLYLTGATLGAFEDQEHVGEHDVFLSRIRFT